MSSASGFYNQSLTKTQIVGNLVYSGVQCISKHGKGLNMEKFSFETDGWTVRQTDREKSALVELRLRS